MSYKITFNPRDVLYFRDGRPLGGAADGNGAQWPLPSVWHSAVLSAFHRTFSDEEISTYAKTHQHARRGEKDRNFQKLKRTKAVFGGTKTLGPFPQKDGKLFFPIPADLLLNEEGDAPAKPAQLLPTELPADCDSNLPSPLKYVLWKEIKPTKKELGQWISEDGLKKYLAGKIDELTLGTDLVKNSDLFDTEARPGIGIDADTGTTKDGAFYAAEYMRLKPGVELVATVDAISVGRNGETDLWEKFEKKSDRSGLIFGGQRGLAWTETSAETKDAEDIVPPAPQVSGKLVKWTLLTPALFNAGWRPHFVDESGNVRLKVIPERKPGQSREAWREAVKTAPDIVATLVAARIAKGIPTSGWKINASEVDKNSGNDGGGAPKATRLLVPAGSVFYFECDSESDAQNLVAALHGKGKSGLLGEQGYGLGICSAWSFSPDTL